MTYRCHSEHREESLVTVRKILRCTQDGKNKGGFLK